MFLFALILVTNCSKEELVIDNNSTFEKSKEDSFSRVGNTPSASGQGTIEWAGIDGKRHFSFHAKTDKNGDVKGSGVLTYTKGDLKLKFSINCIYTQGNIATMSGRITSHSANPDAVGKACRFSVMDNGEGSKADPDRMTPLFWSLTDGPDWPCEGTYSPGTYSEVLEGNVQVN